MMSVCPLRLLFRVSAQLRYDRGMWKQHEQSVRRLCGRPDTLDERAGPARGLGGAGAEAAACLECGNRLARRRRCLYQSEGSVVLQYPVATLVDEHEVLRDRAGEFRARDGYVGLGHIWTGRL